MNDYKGQRTVLPACYFFSWKRLESLSVFSNTFIEVFSEKTLSPSSQLCDYGRVHFKRVGVGVLVCCNKMILMVGQRRYPTGKFSWEIPEGGTDTMYQNPREAAAREVMEETGLSIEIANLEEIMQLHTSNSVTDELCMVYRIELDGLLTPKDSSVFKDEVIMSRWFRLKDCVQYVREGLITDAVSVAAILRETSPHYS